MGPNKGFRALAVAALCTGFAVTAAAPGGTAADAAPAAVASAEQPPLTVDKVVVHPGNTLVMKLRHGEEAVNWISSPAFTRQRPNPMDPQQGTAQIVHDARGQVDAVATIDSVPPGTYPISTRVGGGKGPGITITVVE